MDGTNYVVCGNCQRTCLESNIYCPYCNFKLGINKYPKKEGVNYDPVTNIILGKHYPKYFSDILLGDFTLFLNLKNILLFIGLVALFWFPGLVIATFGIAIFVQLFFPANYNSMINSSIVNDFWMILTVLISIIISFFVDRSEGYGAIYLKNNSESISFLDRRLTSTGMKLLRTEDIRNENEIEVTNGPVTRFTTNNNIMGLTVFKIHRTEYSGTHVKIRYLPDKIKVHGKLKQLRKFLPELNSKDSNKEN